MLAVAFEGSAVLAARESALFGFPSFPCGVKVIPTAYPSVDAPPPRRPSPSWCQPAASATPGGYIPFKRCPLPTLHRQRLCRRHHMFCHRLSYRGGKGELYPAVFSGCRQRAPPRQRVARAVTHFLLLPFILTAKVVNSGNPEPLLLFNPFHLFLSNP